MYDAVKAIKAAADIRETAELYGVRFVGGNRALCPFHDDRHPSASVKNGRFHCYVCGLHLDVFGFVQQMEGCGFREAMERLNGIFRLGLDLKKPIPSAELERRRLERERKEAALAAYRREYEAKQAEFIRLYRMARPEPESRSFGEYARLLGRLDYLEWWFRENHWR